MQIKLSNPLECFDNYPPFWVYAMARRQFVGKKPVGLTWREIAKNSGLSLRSVSRLSNKITWADEKLKVIDAFMRGCNIVLWRERKYLRQHLKFKRGKFGHLSTARWKRYLEKCEEYQKAREK